MRVPIADLAAQYAEIKDELDAALLDVGASGRYILGPHGKALEEELARQNGVRFAAGVASGTDALKIALEALGVGPGTEVITVPFTFVATVEVVQQLGARTVFVDIDRDTFNMDSSQLKSAISPKTKAIVPVHLFGQLAEMEAACAAAGDIPIVEDGAQSIRSSRNGKCAGQFGKAAILSFFPTKNLGALGDGGMILTDDESLYQDCLSLRMHGMPTGDYLYRKVGYASRLDEIQAAVLRVKLRKLEEWNERRRQNASIYCEALAGTETVLPKTLSGNVHTYHQFTIRHPRRDALKTFLKEREIDSGIYYPECLHLQDAYADLGHKPGDFPVAEQASREVLSLPVHAQLSKEQVRFAASRVVEFCHSAVPV
jgi:dTDP-4-amino-4,6-dideoxygalactose transaminase